MTDIPPRHRVRVRHVDEPDCAPEGHSAQDAPENTAETVGYGKPPKAHRFKPGQSGNPKGRRKGSKNFATIIENILSRPVRLKVSGVPQDKKILPAEAVVHVVTAKAMKGERHATELFLGWVQDQDASREQREAVMALNEKEEAILRRMRERFGQGDLS